jgi:spore germination cell wall hydrolase CwlJ-like protein
MKQSNQEFKVIAAIGIILALSVVYMSISAAVEKRIDVYNETINFPKNMTVVEKERQLECLTQNIYWEAGNEPFEGKVAVAQVTLNRLHSGEFADTLCGVVHQKTLVYRKVVCQFSWYCNKADVRKQYVYQNEYEESNAVAKKVLLEGFRLDGMREAMYYHADYVDPKWGKEKITKIGRHIFYKG